MGGGLDCYCETQLEPNLDEVKNFVAEIVDYFAYDEWSDVEEMNEGGIDSKIGTSMDDDDDVDAEPSVDVEQLPNFKKWTQKIGHSAVGRN